jgi:hypothetical protein
MMKKGLEIVLVSFVRDRRATGVYRTLLPIVSTTQLNAFLHARVLGLIKYMWYNAVALDADRSIGTKSS